MKTTISLFIFSVVLLNSAVAQKGPPEFKNRTTLTSYTQLQKNLKSWAKSSRIMHLEVIGRSVLGRELYLAQFSLHHPIPTHDRDKPLILIFAQQHGNEPSGKEAVLQLCQELARGDQLEILKKLYVMIIPQMNPDGSEKGVRRNANNTDLNRDHILLTQPETRALHAVFLKYFPEVTLDVHEYNDFVASRVQAGYVRAYDEMLGAVSNPNICEAIRSYAVTEILPAVAEAIRQAGFSFHRYLVGGPAERFRYRYSTTYINDGRNSLGIYHTLSFILEGRRYGDLTTHLGRRTTAQRAAILGLLHAVADQAPKILHLVQQERVRLLHAVEEFPLIAPRSKYLRIGNLNLLLQIERVPQGGVIDTLFHNFTPFVHIPFYLKRPVGYLLPGKMLKWVEVLQRHQVIMKSNYPPTPCLVESTLIQRMGIFEMEEKQYLDLHTQAELRHITADSAHYVFIPASQPGAHLVALVLEPRSVMNLVQYPGFLDSLRPGEEYPLLRVLRWGE